MGFTIAETIMFSTLQIQAYNSGSDQAELGTGFLVAFCPKDSTFAPALVTNRHILQNYEYVEIPFTIRKADGTPDIGNIRKVSLRTSSLIRHPNEAIDLVILPLQPAFESMKSQGISPFCAFINIGWIPTEEEWNNFDAIEQIVTVGFPKGLRDTANNLPIFRSGITATHPKYDFYGKPEFLIDVSCFKGCSGSPVYAVEYQQTKEISKIYLLGIHRAGVASLFNVETKNAPPEFSEVVSTVNLPIGLGVAIKSRELLAFETILENLIAGANQTI